MLSFQKLSAKEQTKVIWRNYKKISLSSERIGGQLSIMFFIWTSILNSEYVQESEFYLTYYRVLDKYKHKITQLKHEQLEFHSFFEEMKRCSHDNKNQRQYFADNEQFSYLNHQLIKHVLNENFFCHLICKNVIDMTEVREYCEKKWRIQDNIQRELNSMSVQLGQDRRFLEKRRIFHYHILNRSPPEKKEKTPAPDRLNSDNKEIIIISGMRMVGEVTYANSRFRDKIHFAKRTLKLSDLLPALWESEHE